MAKYATLLKIDFFICFFQGLWKQFHGNKFKNSFLWEHRFIWSTSSFCFWSRNYLGASPASAFDQRIIVASSIIVIKFSIWVLSLLFVFTVGGATEMNFTKSWNNYVWEHFQQLFPRVTKKLSRLKISR